jgi:hypothetical protein
MSSNANNNVFRGLITTFYIEIVLDNKTKEKFKNEDLSILPVDLDIVFKTN